MSYIRSTSNPEKLYVFGHKVGRKIQLDFYYYDNGYATCSLTDFRNFIRKIIKNNGFLDYKIKYKNILIEEVLVYLDNNEMVSKEDANKFFKERQSTFKVCLKIGDKSIYMWRVTWEYILDSFNREL